MSISKNKIKYLRSLQQKKFRLKYNIFTVEGHKIALETLGSPEALIEGVYALPEWIEAHRSAIHLPEDRLFRVTADELKQVSALRTPNQVMLVLRMLPSTFDARRLGREYALYLDGIRDPGNFGAILRIADWFGLPYVFCSPDSVDLYNPKVLQATMGAFLRVPVIPLSLPELIARCPGLPVLGAVLAGDNLFTESFPAAGLIVVGNESEGIRPPANSLLTHRLTIPRGGKGGAESLNAAVATGIVCAVLQHRAAPIDPGQSNF